MSNRRRKARWRARQQPSTTVPNRATGGVLTSPVLLPSWDRCHPIGDWEPDFDNAHLKNAAAGRVTLGMTPHPPAPITFAPPGRRTC